MPEDTSRALLAYGLLSMKTAVLVTGLSAGLLVALLGAVITAPAVTPGLAYADLPAAVMAMGAATAFAALSTATAYLSQYIAREGVMTPAGGASRLLLTATFLLMGGAYVAFAVGGAVFLHFCWSAMQVLGRAGPIA